MTICELCNKEYAEHLFQKHLFEEHNLLFSQYIGLISKLINFKGFLKNESKK